MNGLDDLYDAAVAAGLVPLPEASPRCGAASPRGMTSDPCTGCTREPRHDGEHRCFHGSWS